MKTHIYLIGLMVVLLSSCKKEPLVYPMDTYNVKTKPFGSDSGVCMWGEFLLIDATMYITNNETGSETSYNHFGPNKSRSSMRWGGSEFDIETIIRDTTTYSFYAPSMIPGYGKFVLNGDTTKHYAVYHTRDYQSIVEDPTHMEHNLGGSARPFYGYTTNKSEKIVVIRIEEIEGSINGYNCSYFTHLTFKQIKSF